MTGVYLHREPAPHRCHPPITGKPWPAGPAGNIWRCECGHAWIARYLPDTTGIVPFSVTEWARLRWWHIRIARAAS